MANVYARITKISNAVGRSGYIGDKERQEEIVLQKKNLRYDWSEHSAFEKSNKKTNVANNEALEVHIALPNKLADRPIELRQICDDLANKIVGENKDYEYAVHWNHNRTNLHVHILFSERENQLEIEPKIYKRDIYYNFEEKKLSNKSDPKAEIIHHKGEVQKDQDGNIKYQTDIFKAKDTKFIQSSFVHEKNRIVETVMQSYGYDLEYQDKDSPYIAQKKLYKGASEDYIEKAKEWNSEVKKYNAGVNRHLEVEPIELVTYKNIKKEVLNNVKKANSAEKKITTEAIELLRDMADWVRQNVMQLTVYINRKVKEYEFDDMFNYQKEFDREIEKKQERQRRYTERSIDDDLEL